MCTCLTTRTCSRASWRDPAPGALAMFTSLAAPSLWGRPLPSLLRRLGEDGAKESAGPDCGRYSNLERNFNALWGRELGCGHHLSIPLGEHRPAVSATVIPLVGTACSCACMYAPVAITPTRQRHCLCRIHFRLPVAFFSFTLGSISQSVTAASSWPAVVQWTHSKQQSDQTMCGCASCAQLPAPQPPAADDCCIRALAPHLDVSLVVPVIRRVRTAVSWRCIELPVGCNNTIRNDLLQLRWMALQGMQHLRPSPVLHCRGGAAPHLPLETGIPQRGVPSSHAG